MIYKLKNTINLQKLKSILNSYYKHMIFIFSKVKGVYYEKNKISL